MGFLCELSWFLGDATRLENTELLTMYRFVVILGWTRGLEPPTPGATVQCSDQLSYVHHVHSPEHPVCTNTLVPRRLAAVPICIFPSPDILPTQICYTLFRERSRRSLRRLLREWRSARCRANTCVLDFFFTGS